MFVCVLFWFWTTPGWVQGLLLALDGRTTSAEFLGALKGAWESSPGCLCARQLPCPLYYFSNSLRNLFNQVIKMHVRLRVTDIISMSNYVEKVIFEVV